MFVEKLSSGKFRVGEYYKDPLTGKNKKVSVTIDKNTKKELRQAQLLLDDKIREKLRVVDREHYTLRDIGNLYIEYQKKVNKPSTVKRNEFAVNSIIDLLGKDVLIHKLDAGIVRSALLKSKKSPGTLNEFICRYKALINWAYVNDYIDDVRYLQKLKPFKDDVKKEKLSLKYLEKSEINALLENMTVDHWNKFTRFLLLSGLRIGEAIALNLSDVDMDRREISVTKTWDVVNNIMNDTAKTAASTRTVSMQDELYTLVTEIRRDCLPQIMMSGKDYLFQIRGQRYKYYAYCKYLKENSARIGHQVTPHALRHTHVSLLAASGLTLEEISRRVGHEDSSVTKQIYFHVTEQLKEREAERIRSIKIL